MDENFRPYELAIIMIRIERQLVSLTHCINQKKEMNVKNKFMDSWEPPPVTYRSDGTNRHPSPFGYKGKIHKKINY